MDNDLIFTTITRFGTILFLIYTVSVLLSVYRYVMRMAAYHDARADALALMIAFNDKDAQRFTKFAASLSAEKIDFGKAPQTPVEQLIELSKAIKSAQSS